MEKENTTGGFTPPTGNAEVPKRGGVVTAKEVTKDAIKSTKTNKRTIKVAATAKGWFDCKRIEIGTKFQVSEDEYSEIWMEKL